MNLVSLSTEPMSFSIQGAQTSPLTNLTICLKVFQIVCHEENFYKGLFVMDKANRLKTLLRDFDGQAVLGSLFEWFILHTNSSMWCYQVVIAFQLRFMGASRYTSYILSYLNKTDDAEEYCNNRVLQPGHPMYLNLWWEHVLDKCMF